MMGGILNFVAFSFFMGTANYANTFVSQYDGAGRKERIGPAVWQSMYFCVFAGVIMIGISFFARPIMDLVGHNAAVRSYEVSYFKILAAGAWPGLFTAAMSCFYTGRGKTWAVLWINVIRTVLNIAMDYTFIFGKFGFPKMGISGAATATVLSGLVACIIYFFIFLGKDNRGNFNTGDFRFDGQLFKRLMKFGVPNGTQFMLDILGFSLFVIFVGRISTTAMAATAMACQINTLSFMPMIGFGIATSVLVGRSLGKDDPATAQKSAWSAGIMTFGYMLCIATCYIIAPGVFMVAFKVGADATQFAQIQPLVTKLLIFVAFYCVFDTGNIIFSAAIKGAGDTKFVMYVSVILNWIIVVIPTYLAVTYLKGDAQLYVSWTGLTSYVCLLSLIFFLRFLGGKWKNMRVIEKAPLLPDRMPPMPTIETESV